MNHKLPVFCAALTAALPLAAQAQDAPIYLGELILSGGFAPIEADAYGRAVTVIEADEISQSGKVYVADVLRRVPGVSVSESGSPGILTQLRIRGGEGNHTLVLIDGIEVAQPQQGEFSFGGLSSDDIERIEVLRGPQSALYGSSALAGVIDITTKPATELGFSGEIGIDAATDGTLGTTLSLSQRNERGGARLFVTRRDVGGHDVSGESGDRDGDDSETYNLKGDYALTDDITVGGTLRYTRHEYNFDEFNFAAPTVEGLVTDGENRAINEDLFGIVYLEAATFGGRLNHRFALQGANIDATGWGELGEKDTDYSGTRRKATYQITYGLDGLPVDDAAHLLTFAAEWERETYKDNDPDIVFGAGQLEKRTRKQRGYVLAYQGSFDNGIDLQASLRFDDNDSFKNYTTWALGGSYNLANGTTRLHASAATGVQNPTLIEQFGFFSDFVGNPDLEPETSFGWDLGIEQQFWGGRGVVDVTYFQQTLEDEIDDLFNNDLGASQPINLPGKSDRYGLEVAAKVAVTDQLNMGLAYTWLDADETVPTGPSGTREAREVRRPEHEISIGLDYALNNDKTNLSMDITHVRGIYDLNFTTASFISGKVGDDFDRVRLDDYTLVDVGVRHQINDRSYINAGITNLFDTDYNELDGYEAEGRNAFVRFVSKF